VAYYIFTDQKRTNMYEQLLQAQQQQQTLLAILIDPDREKDIDKRLEVLELTPPDMLLIGSSLLMSNNFDAVCQRIKRQLPQIPLYLFPGTSMQLSRAADALLFLSLLSSRNAEMIIGKQVHAAPVVRKLGIPTISTAYLLIEAGNLTSAHYMSNSLPIPRGKLDIAVAHALAADIMGFQAIYLEAGSGAKQAVQTDMIAAVRAETQLPLFVGGGIRDPQTAQEKARAGATIVVVGNHFEQSHDAALLKEFREAVHGVRI
jgi:phosphoglycerol geranylgeranyltransferase